jgi:DNA-binding transcriptional LysR family regulator
MATISGQCYLSMKAYLNRYRESSMRLTDRIGRRLKLHDLHVFMGVVQAGSMGKAARNLNTSQPAISRSIAELERAFGVALLERNTKGVQPTKFGNTLLQCGAAVFDDLRQGVKAIEFMSDPGAGEIRVAGNEPIVAGLVSAVFSRLQKQYPGITIQVTRASALSEQLAELRERKIDLVLARIGDARYNDIDMEILYNEASYVIAGPKSPWFHRRKIRFSDLLGEPWALPSPDTFVGSIFADAFRAAGLEYPRRNAAFGAIYLHLALVAGGPFLALVPGSLLRLGADRHAFKVLPVKSPVPPWPVGMLSLKGRTVTPATQLFIQQLRDVSNGLTARPG